MAASFAIGVTVIGVAAIITLLGILARHLGLWSWAWNRLMATREEKVKLCHAEQPVPSGRPYLLDGEMDWINLWPRSGSYKRFFNLDDVSAAEESNNPDPRMMGIDPGIPPQPLRPAPGPPSRFPDSWDTAGMDMGRGNSIYQSIPSDSLYPAPLERRDSGRSLGSRGRMHSSYKDFGGDSYHQIPSSNASTNPFINTQNYPSYNNPFYGYQPHMDYISTEKDNMDSLSNGNYMARDFLDSHLRNDHKMYPEDPYANYPSSVHGMVDNSRRTNYSTYSPQRTQGSSQMAYDVSLKQALLNQRKRELELQSTISQQRMLDRYDKMKQDEKRIQEEERVLNQLRYENDIIRRSQYENIMKGRSPYELPQMRSYSLEEEKSPHSGRFELERRYSSEEFSTDEMNSSQDYDRMMFDMRAYRSQSSRDSPPPPAPDAISKLNQLIKEKDKLKSQFNQRIHENDRISQYNRTPLDSIQNRYQFSDMEKRRDIPSTPPNTASLTPPDSEFKHSLDRHRSSLADPYSNSLLKERLAQIEQSRFKETENDNQSLLYGTTDLEFKKFRTDPVGEEKTMVGGQTGILGRKNEIEKSYDNNENIEVDNQLQNIQHTIDRRRNGSRKRSNKKDHFDTCKPNDDIVNITIEPEEKYECLDESQSKRNSLSERYEELSKSFAPDISQNHIIVKSPTKSAFQIVPSSVERKNSIVVCKEPEELPKETEQIPNEPEVLTAANASSLGNSPINPRRNFLSYEGSSSWPLSSEQGESQPEEDSSTKRVREYIASLSARLQQLPDGQANMPDTVQNTDVDHQTTMCTFPVTPPSSANRTDSQSSTDTCSSTGGIWTTAPGWKHSTETPPSSAGFCGPTPPNSAAPIIFNDTPPSSASYFSTPPNSCELNGSFEVEGIQGPIHGHGNMKRAQSCDSVNSESSITLGDLEDGNGQVTGYITVQVVYESESADLEVLVNEARDIVFPDHNSSSIDSYVRVFLLPDKSTNMQTRVFKNSRCPAYRERFLFALEEEELCNRSLVFYMYIADKFTNTLIGESHLKLTDIDLSANQPVELTLTDYAQKGIGCGEIMFSLSYLPTAERLTVVIVKAKNLQWVGDKNSADPFVKIYILQDGKKVLKKKTTVKKDTSSPVFNEAMIFNVPASALNNIQLRVTVAQNVPGDSSSSIPVGHVIVGTQATGKALSHWNQMMASLRKPIGMWHSLRR